MNDIIEKHQTIINESVERFRNPTVGDDISMHTAWFAITDMVRKIDKLEEKVKKLEAINKVDITT